MSKILAIADIHIHDYPQLNPKEKFRLHQSKIVAENIINTAKEQGATILVIAGDILEKPILRPYVQAEIKYFLDSLMSYFEKGFIIWGNHDQDNKSTDQNFTDSCLSVMLPSNLYYADKRELVIENSRIAFSNWYPTFDLTWINGKVDVLFTHATIAYSRTDIIASQPLDETKFDLAICGDIHRPASNGKFVSIGIPQKCKMSDSDRLTGVIFDCVTKAWDWVNLNKSDNLMKFEYTQVQSEEGWDSSSYTWKKYKPLIHGINLNGTKKEIKIPAWEEVENLINQIIIDNNLQRIHGEVLKNVGKMDSLEVDFNFTLVRLYCKNFRSIEEVELYFDDLDKILISGKNGSGKSSLLSALRYALVDVRGLKDFIQFGAKENITEVDFYYQGSMYRIRRGSKKFGLWINNEPQKYNNKREFEEDVRVRFPFINYMKLYFFDSDHHKLIGGMTPEEKSDVISKFFKMEKIDVYNETAEVILSKFTKKITGFKEEIEKNEKLIGYIESKLQLIQLPSSDLETLLTYKQEGIELQRKSKLWTEYEISSANLIGRIQNLSETLNKVKERSFEYRNLSTISEDIKNNLQQSTEIIGKINELGTTSIKYNKIVEAIKSNNNLGQRLFREYENLKVTDTCPSCGQIVDNSKMFEERKLKLSTEMSELLETQQILKSQLSELELQVSKESELRTNYKLEQDRLSKVSFELLGEKGEVENSIRLIKEYTLQLNTLNTQLSELILPERVKLPENFLNTMSIIESGINTWNSYNSLISDKDSAMRIVESTKNDLSQIMEIIKEIQTYIKLTGPTGKIYEEILTKLSTQFSDNKVKYEVVTYSSRGKDYLELASYFNNNGNWVNKIICLFTR